MGAIIAMINQMKSIVWMFVRNGSSSVKMANGASLQKGGAMVEEDVLTDQTKKIVKIIPVLKDTISVKMENNVLNILHHLAMTK